MWPRIYFYTCVSFILFTGGSAPGPDPPGPDIPPDQTPQPRQPPRTRPPLPLPPFSLGAELPLGPDSPLDQTTSRADTPPDQTPPDQTPPQTRPPGTRPTRADPPNREQTFPLHREADSSIRSTSGRYASYWNAFVFRRYFPKELIKNKYIRCWKFHQVTCGALGS